MSSIAIPGQFTLDFPTTPYGYCRCGCGQKTQIAPQTDSRFGHVCGEPKPYILGHKVRVSDAQRFWPKVRKTDSCWLWTSYRKSTGHGMFHIGNTAVHAHRFSWELHNGPIPDGLCVLHNCPGGDNPACVNPAHLFLGTQLDNIADCKRKGRTAKGANSPVALHPEIVRRGVRHHLAKLTEADVMAIRDMYARGVASQKDIGDLFGVSQSTVMRVVNRIGWCHV